MIQPSPRSSDAPDLVAAPTTAQMLDALAIRVNGSKAWDGYLTMEFVITDEGQTILVELHHGGLIHQVVTGPRNEPQVRFELSKTAFTSLFTGTSDLAELKHHGDVKIFGDPEKLSDLLNLLHTPDTGFTIVAS
jgi:alkyl sulfatase BDS1-like metallo-beta-lactamase superfamily hydrolase